MPDADDEHEARITDIVADVEAEQERLESPDAAPPPPGGRAPETPEEWTAWAHAKLGAARGKLEEAAREGTGKARAGALEEAGGHLRDLSEDLPTGPAVGEAQRTALADPDLAARLSDIVEDVETAADRSRE